mmetsp:Transcript_24213/g.78129  ORF Transcript_24213/g.78129 Transcript_24213/m.78129 type:complete len:295 (-) Transcript_24213:868-1752(-)
MYRRSLGFSRIVKVQVSPSTCRSADRSAADSRSGGGEAASREPTASPKVASTMGACSSTCPSCMPGSLCALRSADGGLASVAPSTLQTDGMGWTSWPPHREEIASTGRCLPRSIVRVIRSTCPPPAGRPRRLDTGRATTRSDCQYVPSSPSVTKAARCCTGGPRRPLPPRSSRSRVRSASTTARTARRARSSTGACLDTLEPSPNTSYAAAAAETSTSSRSNRFQVWRKKAPPSAKRRRVMSTEKRLSTRTPSAAATASVAGRLSRGTTSEAKVSSISVSSSALAHTPSCHGRE